MTAPTPLPTPSAAPLHPAEVVVDLGAVRDNVATLRAAAGSAAVMAVVKADAYGHGLVPSARAAVAGRGRMAGRGPGRGGPRAAGGRPAGARPGVALRPGIRPRSAGARRRRPVGERAVGARPGGRRRPPHAAGRPGCTSRSTPGSPAAAARVAEWDGLVRRAAAAQASGEVEVVGVWSHMANADDPGHPTVRRQVEVFHEAVASAAREGVRPQLRHLANSAATLTSPDTHLDLVRPGLAVYGLSPVPQLAGPAELGLRPAMSLRARLALVKDVPAGQGVSYAHAYTTPVRHDARSGAAGLRRRRAAARLRRGSGAGGRHPHVGGRPGVHGPVRRRPRTRCGAARLGRRSRRPVRRRQRRPHRPGVGRGGRDDQLRGRHPHQRPAPAPVHRSRAPTSPLGQWSRDETDLPDHAGHRPGRRRRRRGGRCRRRAPRGRPAGAAPAAAGRGRGPAGLDPRGAGRRHQRRRHPAARRGRRAGGAGPVRPDRRAEPRLRPEPGLLALPAPRPAGPRPHRLVGPARPRPLPARAGRARRRSTRSAPTSRP